MNFTPKPLEKTAAPRAFLSLLTAEGLLAWLFLFYNPSETGSAVLWGYSLPRLLLAGLTLLLLAPLAAATWKAWRQPPWLSRLLQALDSRFEQNDFFAGLVVSLAYLAALIVAALFLFASPLALNLGVLPALYRHALPLVVWLLLALLEALALLRLAWPQSFRRLRAFSPAAATTLFLLVLLTLTLIHWTILALRLDLLTSIPGWFWQFHQKGFSLRHAWLLAIFALPIALAALFFKSPQAVKRNLFLLILAGCFLQYGFGLVEGESIRLKYANSSHSVYAQHASDRPDLVEMIRNYETGYGQQIFLDTKPPGVLTVYILAQKLSNLVAPQNTFDGRFLRLTNFLTVVFPPLSFLVLILIYRLSRSLTTQTERAYLPALLYIVCPNVILIPLFLDQALYPLMFMLGVTAAVWLTRKPSFILAALTGLGIYVAMFISFSMLTLLPFAAILIGMDWLLNRKDLKQTVMVLAGLAIGMLVGYLAFKLLLNYDFFIRYQNMTVIRREINYYIRYNIAADPGVVASGYRPSLGKFLSALVLNHIEYAAWVGVPVFLLFVVQAGKTLWRFVQRRITWKETLLGAYLVFYLLLNLFGELDAEVARLWLFLVPMTCIFAGLELGELFQQRKKGVYLILVLQLVTMILTYQFQDFYT